MGGSIAAVALGGGAPTYAATEEWTAGTTNSTLTAS
jgi:hypothetical protein